MPGPLVSETVNVLLGARILLSNKRNWLRNDYNNENKTKFCLVGALKYFNEFSGAIEEFILTQAYRQSNNPDNPFNYACLESFNDSIRTQHKDVINLLDISIAEALRIK